MDQTKVNQSNRKHLIHHIISNVSDDKHFTIKSLTLHRSENFMCIAPQTPHTSHISDESHNKHLIDRKPVCIKPPTLNRFRNFCVSNHKHFIDQKTSSYNATNTSYIGRLHQLYGNIYFKPAVSRSKQTHPSQNTPSFPAISSPALQWSFVRVLTAQCIRCLRSLQFLI